MTTQQQHVNWKKILDQAGSYPLEAFKFVREGLSYTADRVHEQHEDDDVAELDRHVTGQQLCLGLRDYAIWQYGLMAPAVLEHWNILRTDDFGRIVFAMIDAGLMSKTSDDSIDDFRAVFDFSEAFSRDELVSRIGVG